MIAPNDKAPFNYVTSIRFVIVSDLIGGDLKVKPDKHSHKAEWVELDHVQKLQLRNTDEIKKILAIYAKYVTENTRLLPLSAIYDFVRLS